MHDAVGRRTSQFGILLLKLVVAVVVCVKVFVVFLVGGMKFWLMECGDEWWSFPTNGNGIGNGLRS